MVMKASSPHSRDAGHRAPVDRHEERQREDEHHGGEHAGDFPEGRRHHAVEPGEVQSTPEVIDLVRREACRVQVLGQVRDALVELVLYPANNVPKRAAAMMS